MRLVSSIMGLNSNYGYGGAECLVMNGKLVADVGSVDEIRRRWGDRATTGSVAGAPEISRKSGLKFIYLRPGQAVYPGFQGTLC